LSSFFIGCGADEKTITLKDGTKKVYQPYGLLNEDEEKDPTIRYKTSKSAVVWSCIFCETIVVPVILCGYYLYEPAEEKEVK